MHAMLPAAGEANEERGRCVASNAQRSDRIHPARYVLPSVCPLLICHAPTRVLHTQCLRRRWRWRRWVMVQTREVDAEERLDRQLLINLSICLTSALYVVAVLAGDTMRDRHAFAGCCAVVQRFATGDVSDEKIQLALKRHVEHVRPRVLHASLARTNERTDRHGASDGVCRGNGPAGGRREGRLLPCAAAAIGVRLRRLRRRHTSGHIPLPVKGWLCGGGILSLLCLQ